MTTIGVTVTGTITGTARQWVGTVATWAGAGILAGAGIPGTDLVGVGVGTIGILLITDTVMVTEIRIMAISDTIITNTTTAAAEVAMEFQKERETV